MNLEERNQNMREFFNRKIDSYDETHAKFMKTKKAITENLEGPINKVLDLGAGTGLELIHLFELNKDAKVTVIDITENMLKELKKRSFADHVDIICGDFFEVDFGNNYDAVISTSALHHFKKDEKLKLYKKVFDCLKVNGQFINCDKIAINEDIENEQLYALDHDLKAKHIDTPLTVDHELEVLNNVGFSEITSSEVDRDDYKLIKARKLK